MECEHRRSLEIANDILVNLNERPEPDVLESPVGHESFEMFPLGAIANDAHLDWPTNLLFCRSDGLKKPHHVIIFGQAADVDHVPVAVRHEMSENHW